MAADTRDRILAAATRLYAAPEAGGPALRAIAREGGVNSALIHYHFGSREGLLEAVLLRDLEPVQARRGPIIEALRAGPSADGTDLARLCVVPIAALPRGDAGGPEPALRLLARAVAEDRARLDALTVQHFAPMLFGLRDVLASALPSLSGEAKQRRFRLAVDAAVTTLAGDEATRVRATSAEAFDGFAHELTTFLAGALDAPA
ncbi:MAG: TetR family transcriptional regulator [Myxococcota bacterium]